jgi:hypothetical protein
MKEREIIQGLITELEQLSKGKHCHHGVGVCWCATFEALEYAQAWIRQDGYLGPRSLCECGHGGDGYPSSHASQNGSPGHGGCYIEGCDCRQFTFAGFYPEFADFRNTANATVFPFDDEKIGEFVRRVAPKMPGGGA